MGASHRLGASSALGFEDALDGANRGALRRVMVPHALYTGFGVDHIDRVTLADGLGGALGHACTARDALLGDFHGHGRIS